MRGKARLVQGRAGKRSRGPLAGADPWAIKAIAEQHGIEVDESTGDMNRLKRRMPNRLDAGAQAGRCPVEPVRVPAGEGRAVVARSWL